MPLHPLDLSAYAERRCDRLVADVEAARVELGLDRLLAHSGGANVAYRYAERHPAFTAVVRRFLER